MRGHMAEREPIMGDWGGAPNGSRVWLAGQGAKPPEAERFLALECPKKAAFWLYGSFGNYKTIRLN